MKKYNITVNGTTYEVIVEEADATGVSAPVYTPAPTYERQGNSPDAGSIATNAGRKSEKRRHTPSSTSDKER